MSQAVQIFIAYSRQDVPLLEDLRKHLRPLERTGKVNVWYDGLIEPGAVWEQAIKDNLHQADIILLLVSADSINSDYFYEKEVADALERHEAGKARVVPLILRPCVWQTTPLGDLQALPKDALPVTLWPDRDAAWSDAVASIWRYVEMRGQEQELERQRQAEEARRQAEAEQAVHAAAIRQQEEAKARQQAQELQERRDAVEREKHIIAERRRQERKRQQQAHFARFQHWAASWHWRWALLGALLLLLAWGGYRMVSGTRSSSAPPNEFSGLEHALSQAMHDRNRDAVERLRYELSQLPTSIATQRRLQDIEHWLMAYADSLERIALAVDVVEVQEERSAPDPKPASKPVEKKQEERQPPRDEIYDVVEEMPRFPGCEVIGVSSEEKRKCANQKLQEFIYSNIKYPEAAAENGIEGTVLVNFVVDQRGYISNAQVIRDIGGGCGTEALRVVNMMKDLPQRWTPGQQRGRPVKVVFSLPVRFKLSD